MTYNACLTVLPLKSLQTFMKVSDFRFVDVLVKGIFSISFQVTCSSFLAAARVRNERGLDRIQALQCMIELVTVCSRIGTHVPHLLSSVASILAQGPRLVSIPVFAPFLL